MADEACSSSREILTLFASNGDVTVWDPEVIFELRTKHRIVGSLVGALPRKPRQNVHLSVPLVLSKEETTLLLEKGFARLVESETNPPLPSEEVVQRFKELREESMMEQAKMFIEDREVKIQELADVIEAGRKRKRERKERTSGNEENTSAPNKLIKLENDCTEGISNSRTKAEEGVSFKETGTPMPEHVREAPDGGMRSQEIVQAENDEALDGISCKDVTMTTLSEIKEVSAELDPEKEKLELSYAEENTNNHGYENDGDQSKIASGLQGTLIHVPTKVPNAIAQRYPTAVWHYPDTELEKLRYRIFQDLWEKGLYITSGCKFGGDFLAYPGDPLKFHSFYIVIVVPWEQRTGMLDIISMGRLGATVKKTAVFSTVDTDGNVVYTSVKWSGIS